MIGNKTKNDPLMIVFKTINPSNIDSRSFKDYIKKEFNK